MAKIARWPKPGSVSSVGLVGWSGPSGGAFISSSVFCLFACLLLILVLLLAVETDMRSAYPNANIEG